MMVKQKYGIDVTYRNGVDVTDRIGMEEGIKKEYGIRDQKEKRPKKRFQKYVLGGTMMAIAALAHPYTAAATGAHPSQVPVASTNSIYGQPKAEKFDMLDEFRYKLLQLREGIKARGKVIKPRKEQPVINSDFYQFVKVPVEGMYSDGRKADVEIILGEVTDYLDTLKQDSPFLYNVRIKGKEHLLKDFIIIKVKSAGSRLGLRDIGLDGIIEQAEYQKSGEKPYVNPMGNVKINDAIYRLYQRIVEKANNQNPAPKGPAPVTTIDSIR